MKLKARNRVAKLRQDFIDELPIDERTFYAHRKDFRILFEDVSRQNTAFTEVIETVSCYRAELANSLRDLQYSYNDVYL